MAKLFAFEDANTNSVELEEDNTQDVIEAEALNEEATELEQQTDALQEGAEAANQLEELGDVVDKSVEENGGLDPIAAEAVKIAYDAILARVGIRSTDSEKVFAAENFASRSTRSANTRIALEASIKDTVSKIWNKIKEFITKLILKVKEVWNKIFYNAEKTGKKINDLKKEIKNTDKSKPSGKKEIVLTGSLAEVFAISKKVTTIQNNTVTQPMLMDFVTKIQNAIGLVNSKLLDIINALVNDRPVKNLPTSLAGMVYLPFGKKLVVELLTKREVEASEDAVPTLDVRVMDSDLMKMESVKVDIMNKSEMLKVLDSAIDVLDGLKRFNEAVNTAVKGFDTAKSVIEVKISELNKSGNTGQDKDNAVEARKTINKTRDRFVGGLKAVAPSYHVIVVRTARAMMAIVEKMYATYTND